jgi:hypothetical protein
MIETLACYLGKPASTMLEALPFKLWPFEKSFENDLPEPIIYYIFPNHGLELRCDRDDKVSVIFLSSDEYHGFDDSLLDIPFSSNRQQVRDLFGTPSKSGDKIKDQILGEYGPWDRFARLGYTVHFEFQPYVDRIRKITIMRADIVPKSLAVEGCRSDPP